MSHPAKHTRHEPFRDYLTRDRVCRELEKEFGLFMDNGRKKDTPGHEKKSGHAGRIMQEAVVCLQAAIKAFLFIARLPN